MFIGKKVKLRAYHEDDTQTVWELISEEGLRETLDIAAIFPYSFQSEKNFITSAINNSSEQFHFAIEDLSTKNLIGGCGINQIDRKNSTALIGIWLGKQHHGKGFASDAMRVLCNHIFDELNINKVKLEYFEFNEAGKKCYEAVGFVQEGVLRNEIWRYGKYHNTIRMGLFRDELKEIAEKQFFLGDEMKEIFEIVEIPNNTNFEEIINFFQDIGWPNYSKKVKNSISKSLITLGSYSKNQLVGILVAFGDGDSVIFIDTVAVHRKFRRKGIATKLIDSLREKFPQCEQIVLLSGNDTDANSLYFRYGFKDSTTLGVTAFIL